MEASGEAANSSLEDDQHSSLEEEEQQLELELADIRLEDLPQKVQAVQTDCWTEESGVNTQPDWESQVEALFEYSSSLVEQYDGLMRQQDQEAVAHEKHKQQLQKKKEDATRQYQVMKVFLKNAFNPTESDSRR